MCRSRRVDAKHCERTGDRGLGVGDFEHRGNWRRGLFADGRKRPSVLSLGMIQRSVLLPTRLAGREGDRAAVSELALWVLAPTQGAAHADLNTIDLLEPGLIEGLCGRNVIGLRFGGRTGRVGNQLGSAPPTSPASALCGRRRRRVRRIRHKRRTAMRGRVRARSGLKRGGYVLATKGHLV